MKKNVYVSVSTDPIKEYQSIIDYSIKLQGIADFMHCDIMDGKFVKNKTYDAGVVNNINQNCLTMLDVHLMCSEPLKSIDDYLKAGANILTIHYEAFEDKNDIVDAVKKIKSADALAGLSIKPETQVKEIKMFLYDLDVILVMSVEPGESGQKFMTSALDKIRQLDEIRKQNNYRYKIEVDGGINADNAKDIVDVGADILVSGNYVYKAQDKKEAIASLKATNFSFKEKATKCCTSIKNYF